MDLFIHILKLKENLFDPLLLINIFFIINGFDISNKSIIIYKINTAFVPFKHKAHSDYMYFKLKE